MANPTEYAHWLTPAHRARYAKRAGDSKAVTRARLNLKLKNNVKKEIDQLTKERLYGKQVHIEGGRRRSLLHSGR